MWGKRNILQRIKGPSIKYVTLFLANFYPLPLSHFVTHPGTIPRKYVTHLGTHPQIFSKPSTKIPDKSPLYKFSLNCSRGFYLGGFVRKSFVWSVFPGWFLSVPLLSEYICYNRNLDITLNFMFHMYDKEMYTRDVTCSLPPPPVTNCHTSDPLLSFERDVLYGRPPRRGN